MKSRAIQYILCKNQFGFTKIISTNDVTYELIEVTNHLNNRNKRNITIFLDLANIFDTVSHAVLLKILEKDGV